MAGRSADHHTGTVVMEIAVNSAVRGWRTVGCGTNAGHSSRSAVAVGEDADHAGRQRARRPSKRSSFVSCSVATAGPGSDLYEASVCGVRAGRAGL